MGTCSFTPDPLRNCTTTCDGIPVSRTQAGAVVGSYQYRRYQTGASPLWTPLRFPGQYYDAESDLFENWNRYYAPDVATYRSVDPLLLDPTAAIGFRTPAPYGYASENPLRFDDPTGLVPEKPDGITVTCGSTRLRTHCDKMECACKTIELEVKGQCPGGRWEYLCDCLKDWLQDNCNKNEPPKPPNVSCPSE
jgi:RHS repeat-associated protein